MIPLRFKGLTGPGAVIVAIVAVAAACGSPGKASGPTPAKASATGAPSTTAASTTTNAPTTTPSCVGLSICPPPPPDAQGNPACYYADGWRAVAPGAGIEVWYFHEPQNMSKPERVTALVRRKDGSTESQDANIDAGQQVHRFEFPGIDQSVVDEVLFTTGAGRCFVIGPG